MKAIFVKRLLLKGCGEKRSKKQRVYIGRFFRRVGYIRLGESSPEGLATPSGEQKVLESKRAEEKRQKLGDENRRGVWGAGHGEGGRRAKAKAWMEWK